MPFSHYLPLKKAMTFFGANFNPWFEIGLVVMEKKTIKMWRINNDDNAITDKFQLEKFTWTFCSGELKTRISSDMFSKFSQSKIKVGYYTFLRILATCSI